MNIKIISDSTCDLPKHLVEEHNITIFPLTIIKDGESYKDNVTITPAEIFAHVAAGGSLCSTAAGNLGDYQELFSQYADQYDGVLRVVDSQNLSTGQGHVVLYACQLAQTCESLEQLQADVQAYTERVEASFLLDRLEYMVKGGRCSAAAALGANLLNLKPCIEVRGGKMGVVKKYRGNYAKCLENYVKDRLNGREDLVHDLLFLTYTPVSDQCLAAVKNAISLYGSEFDRMEECQAGCTVSCHCGPGTLGVLFIRK